MENEMTEIRQMAPPYRVRRHLVRSDAKKEAHQGQKSDGEY